MPLKYSEAVLENPSSKRPQPLREITYPSPYPTLLPPILASEGTNAMVEFAQG